MKNEEMNEEKKCSDFFYINPYKMTKCAAMIVLTILATAIVATVATIAILSWQVRKEERFFQFSVQEWCDRHPPIKYDPVAAIPTITSSPLTYDQNLARSLFAICMAVSASNCPGVASTFPIPPGYATATRLVIQNPQNKKHKDMYAYVFESIDKSTVLICFTGTILMDQWQNDIHLAQVNPAYLPKGALVHSGFADVYNALRPQILALLGNSTAQQVVITGHSLGGGLSAICAADYALNLAQEKGYPARMFHYSFAAPRPGDGSFTALFDKSVPQSHRLANVADLVPSLPPPVIPQSLVGNSITGNSAAAVVLYNQTGGLIPFQLNLGDYRANHTDAYTRFLAQPGVGII